MCSEEVQASVASTQLNVLSVAPFNVIPPPSAVTSVGLATEPSSIFLSSTVIVVALIVSVVPLTVNVPVTTKLLLTVVVPEPAPMLTVVAAPPMFRVVALVLNNVAVPVPVVVISEPLTARSPASVKLPVPVRLAIFVVPPYHLKK